MLLEILNSRSLTEGEMYDTIQYRFLVSHNVTFCQKSYLTNKTEKGICLMMDTTIIYNDYLSGDAKALERLMEIYGDKLTLYINGYIKSSRFGGLVDRSFCVSDQQTTEY